MKKEPSIFTHTIYRLPTKDELNEVNACNLTAQEIVNGFGYTLIGRGIKSSKNIAQIIESINMLCKLFPDNNEYKKALELAKNNKPKLSENKQIIKDILNECVNLDFKEKKSGFNFFNLMSKGEKVGFVVLAQINKGFGKDTVEIVNVGFDREFLILEVGQEMIDQIFKMFEYINRIVIQPNIDSKDFWYKLGAHRVDEKYMIILRGH